MHFDNFILTLLIQLVPIHPYVESENTIGSALINLGKQMLANMCSYSIMNICSKTICTGGQPMDKVKGSMEALSAMQLTEEMDGLDAQSKALLHSKEVLAVILQNTVEEYKGYSREEIMGFIEADSLSEWS